MSPPHTCLFLCHCVSPAAHITPLTLLLPSRSLTAAPALPVLPAAFVMVQDPTLSYTQILQKADATTARIIGLCATLAIAVGMIVAKGTGVMA